MEAIRGFIKRVVSMVVEETHSLETVVIKIGTICNSLISIMVSLVDLFMSYFRLIIEVNLAIVIIMDREVARL